MREKIASYLRSVASFVDHGPKMSHSIGNVSPPVGKESESIRIAFQEQAYMALSKYTSFEGKEILEVGGTQAGDSAFPFIRNGAASVIITGLGHVYQEGVDAEGKIKTMPADALKLSSLFGSNRFDVVYGLSIIEHIPSPQVFIDEVYAVLKPGGMAYFQGAPIWSSPKGHHLWVATWGGPYRDKTSRNYLFNGFPGTESTNPLPDWSHLLMTPEEMRKYLKKQDIPSADIDCIIDWVFVGDEINRINMTDIAKAYTNSKLTVLEANTSRVNVPEDVQASLRKRCGNGIDFGIDAVNYLLMKV